MCSQGHSVAGSVWAVSFVLLLSYGQVTKTTKIAYTFLHGVGHMWCC